MLWRHSALYLVARGLPGLVNLLGLVVYTRLLSPSDYGRYALVIATTTLANRLLFEWLRLALLRFLPVFRDRQESFNATVAAGFLALVTASVMFAGLAFAVVDDPVIRPLVPVGLVLLWTQALFDLQLEVSRAQLSPLRYGIMTAVKTVLSFGSGVGFVLLGMGSLGLILGLILGSSIAVAAPTLRAMRRVKLGLCDPALLWQLTRYGAPLTATVGLGFIIASSDRLLIGWLLNEDAVGRYAVGYDLANLSLGVLLMIVNLAAYPLIVRAFEHQGIGAARVELSATLSALLAVGLPTAAGFALLAPNIAEVTLGREFRADAVVLMPLIAVAALLRDVKAFYLDLAFQLGRSTLMQIWVSTAAAAANLALNLWWIPRFGIVGAAYATIAAYVIAFVLSALLGRRVLALPPPGRDCLKIVLATSGMAYVLWLQSDAIGPAALVAQIASGGLAYVALVWLLDAGGVRVYSLALLRRLMAVSDRTGHL